MRLLLNTDFAEECARYAFRFCCEDCVYQNAEDKTCYHGWPNEQHRREYYCGNHPAQEYIIYCKEFELA